MIYIATLSCSSAFVFEGVCGLLDEYNMYMSNDYHDNHGSMQDNTDDEGKSTIMLCCNSQNELLDVSKIKEIRILKYIDIPLQNIGINHTILDLYGFNISGPPKEPKLYNNIKFSEYSDLTGIILSLK